MPSPVRPGAGDPDRAPRRRPERVATPDDARRALTMLSALGDDRAGVVDESEIERLGRLAGGEAALASADVDWCAWLLVGREGPAGYASVRIDDAGRGVGEAAASSPTDRDHLLSVLVAHARAHRTEIEIWVRRLDDDALARIAAAGYTAVRTLGVLARQLGEQVPARATTARPRAMDVVIRAARGDDLDDVVAVLDVAYRDTPESGWDRARFDARAATDWFRLDDLLVAEVDGVLAGVHWLKRRSERVGEVYNLAVRPALRGRGVGGRLLDAGLDHLERLGCDEVVLWVDLANAGAERLYVTRGFARVWLDACLAPRGAAQASSGPRDSR